MTNDEAEILLAPFKRTWEAARKYEGIASVLGRASFQVELPSDRKALMELCERYMEYAQALRDSVPAPSDTVPNEAVERRLL